MKILFYDTKNYDKESFDKQLKNYPGIEMDYLKTDLTPKTAPLAKGFDAVCAFFELFPMSSRRSMFPSMPPD